MANEELTATIAGLLHANGLHQGDSGGITLTAIDGGGNNRVFAVDSSAGKFVAKAYFNDAADTRDRLGAEYGFLSYAADIGLTTVPKPVACSIAQHVGIYEYVNGIKLNAGQLSKEHVLAAAGFIAALNAGTARGQALPPASEACFDIDQHLTTVDRRLVKLLALPVNDDIDRQAQALVKEISTVWHDQRAYIAATATDMPPLAAADRCISPSDFGFHNALLKDDGGLCFIDFEYAGWDDPAKMAGDFFCQPAVPVAPRFFDDFISAALKYSDQPETLRARAHLLLPASQIKWCCIMLNEFLPTAARRRQFANPTSLPEQRKRTQLDKTLKFFQSRLA